MNTGKSPSTRTNGKIHVRARRMDLELFFVAAIAFCLPGPAARAQTDLYVTDQSSGSAGEYTTSANGAAITGSTPAFLTGMNSPWGIAVSGTDIFVLNITNGSVGEYTTTGGTLNASLITGLPASSIYGIAVSGPDIFLTNTAESGTNIYIGEYTVSGTLISGSTPQLFTAPSPYGIAASGTNLFVANNQLNGNEQYVVGEYTTTGGTINASLFHTQYGSSYIAVSGTLVFVDNFGNGGSIGEYTTTGGTLNASLVTGAGNLGGIAVSGSNIYAVNYSSDTIQEYTLSGTVISSSNTSLITGLDFPQGIAAAAPAVPGLAGWRLLLLGSGLLIGARFHLRRRKA